MYGVLLTGGLASRLRPLTTVTNKHLLPIYNKPMIQMGIELLRDLGCDKIIIILGGNSVGDIVNLVKDGSQFGVEVTYKYQSEPKGISHAIYLAKDIIVDEHNETTIEPFLVLLGDNIFSDTKSLKDSIDIWLTDQRWDARLGKSPAKPFAVFLTPSDNPHQYGQPILKDGDMTIEKFVEKDETVDHNLVVSGLYGLQDFMAFWHIEKQQPSARGEYEITDTLTAELPNVRMFHYNGYYSDCGTPEGLAKTTQYFMERDKE